MKKLYLAWLICLMAFQVSAQQRWVTGVVADTNGVPVVGATVTVKGGTNGAITNSDGSFRIEASDSDILVFKYLGYDEQEIQVGPRTRIEIELRESAHQLDDVVVTGYQTISKERATGSFDIIDKAQLEKPSGSIASRLIGSAAGLVGTQDAYGNPVGHRAAARRGRIRHRGRLRVDQPQRRGERHRAEGCCGSLDLGSQVGQRRDRRNDQERPIRRGGEKPR